LISSNQFGPSNKYSDVVTVHENPTIAIVASRTVLGAHCDQSILTASGGVSYTWSTNQNTPVITVGPFMLGQGYYTFKAVGENQFGCIDTAQIVLKVTTCGSISEINGSTISSVYPNPTNGIFEIQTASSDQFDYTIINLLGSAVRHGKFEENISVDFSVQPSGIYFLMVSRNNNIIYKIRIVRE
jgi:hypothetical protein